MGDFLWHKVSKKEQEIIKKEAKRIMDSFSKSLSSVESEAAEEIAVKRELQTREETRTSSDKRFRKVFFENTPSKSGNYIKTEKGKWK